MPKRDKIVVEGLWKKRSLHLHMQVESRREACCYLEQVIIKNRIAVSSCRTDVTRRCGVYGGR